MTLRQAFFRKVASPALLKRWQGVQKITIRDHAPLWAATYLGLLLFASTIGYFPYAWFGWAVGGSIAGVCSIVALQVRGDLRRFLRDCQKLNEICMRGGFDSAGLMGEPELRSFADANLTNRARRVRSAERDTAADLDGANALLSYDFDLLKQFGLADMEGYGRYFKTADESLGPIGLKMGSGR